MNQKYDLKIEGELKDPVIPDEDAPLREQRATARAVKLLFPWVEVSLSSIRDQNGSKVTRELEI